MKNLLVVLFLVLFAINVQAQWYQKYGVTSINGLSEEQLKFSLHKAEINLKTGKILTITGLGAGVLGIAIGVHATAGVFNNDLDKTFNGMVAGSLLMLGGMGRWL